MFKSSTLKSVFATAGFLFALGASVVSFAKDAKDQAANPTAESKALKPAMVFDTREGKDDSSFGAAAYAGIQKFHEETKIPFQDFSPASDAQKEQGVRKFAEKGFTHIIAVGYSFAEPVKRLAGEFPQTKFLLIDSCVDAPNVQCALFKEHEGSFLVGVMAALASKTGKVGFVGGQDMPLIHKFAKGYEEGAKHVNPDVEVFVNMIGTTGDAWRDPGKGAELARSQFDRGADVIFAAAGPSGDGVYQVASDLGRLAIGVDSNQNWKQPGTMLTSMLKRVDVAVYNFLKQSEKNEFKPGPLVYGVAEEGVGYAMDDNNKSLVSKSMIDAVEKAKQAIIKGEIKVTDFTATPADKKTK